MINVHDGFLTGRAGAVRSAGNVEIAAMMAPRPLGLTAANDWTADIETEGLPELKAH